MPTIHLLYFSTIRTHLSTPTTRLPIPPHTRIAALPALIAAHHAHTADERVTARILASCAWSVNEVMMGLDDEEEGGDGGDGGELRDGDVVGVIPPVSGG
jgi:molybdopterin converting factor small subunit